MSHIDPRAKIALGFVFLALSMSVTFFVPAPPPPPLTISAATFAEVRRVSATENYRDERVADERVAEESERLLREVTALREELNDLDRIGPAVSSPAPR